MVRGNQAKERETKLEGREEGREIGKGDCNEVEEV